MAHRFAALLIVAAASALAGASHATDHNKAKPQLEVGQYMMVGEYLVAPDKRSHAVLQRDGNLCVYPGLRPDPEAANPQRLWCSGSTRTAGDYYVILKPDSDLCIHRGKVPVRDGGAVWCWGDRHPLGGRYFVRVSGPSINAYQAIPGKDGDEMPPRLLWAAKKGPRTAMR